MPKPSLKPAFADLEVEMIRTFLAGHKQWRPDLSYPESHSDMQAGIRALLKRYEITPRAVPLDWREIEETEK
jgi:hypothetical protein